MAHKTLCLDFIRAERANVPAALKYAFLNHPVSPKRKRTPLLKTRQLSKQMTRAISQHASTRNPPCPCSLALTSENSDHVQHTPIRCICAFVLLFVGHGFLRGTFYPQRAFGEQNPAWAGAAVRPHPRTCLNT